MTLYPKIRNIKQVNLALIILMAISVLIALICVIVNVCTSTEFWWSLIVIAGIVYTWVTVTYSIRRNINIASSVMIQLIAISILTLCIDYILGYSSWAINLAIPIIICVANVTIFILTLVSVHRYLKYAVYQLIIFVLSMIPLIIFFAFPGVITTPIFMIISSSIALFTFVCPLILCGRSIMEELDRRLHM